MRRNRPAFTLLEVILVLAILVLVAAITYPSIEAMYGNYRVQAAADQVRAVWAQARSQAVDTGRPYRFAVIPDKGNFRIAPDSAEFWSNGGAASDDTEGSEPPLIVEDALPRGIRFTIGDAAVGNSDDMNGETVLPPEEVNGSMWMGVVTFLPDGTATALDGRDASEIRIIFQAKNASPMVLKLRTLTGTVSARPYQEGEDRR